MTSVLLVNETEPDFTELEISAPHPCPADTLPTRRTALWTADGPRTLDEIHGRAFAVAAHLRGLGLRRGDRVALKAQNSLRSLTTLLALIHLDVSIMLLDDGQRDADCLRAIEIGAARWLLTDRYMAVGTDVELITFDALDTSVAPVDGYIDTAAWFRRADATITWSSGSTGTPKGVVRSGPALQDVLRRTTDRMGYDEHDVLLPLVPFSHFYGLTIVLLWWSQRCALILAPNGRLDQALQLGARAGATVVDATPSTYHTILNVLERRPELRTELGSVRMWCVGGAPLAGPLAEAFRATVGQSLLDGYGTTEVGNVAMASREHATGCGRPVEGVTVEIRDECGQLVTGGETGVIWVRSPGMMSGYLGPDGEVLPCDREAPYCTEDLGHWTPDGSLVVVGRKHAVHRFGHTLYPDIIERRAERCGQPVKIVPVADERRGSALVFVVEDPAAGDASQWRQRLNAVLASYERPNRVVVVPRFPLLSNGKPDLVGLRAVAEHAVDGTVLDTVGTPVSATASDERRAALRRVYEFLRDEPDQVSAVLTDISNYKSVQLEVEAAMHALEGAEEEIRRYRPETVSHVAVFMSSNVLLYSYVLYLLIPGLYAERITFRPSGQVFDSTRRLHELLAPVHGMPIELSSTSQRAFLRGPVGEASVVVFTGSYGNAEEVRAQLDDSQLFLFFGQGVNPFIVIPDADLELAARDAVRIRMLNSGQDCFAPDVYLVPESLAERFVALVTANLANLRYGGNDDRGADYGPLCYESALRTATEYLTRCATRIVYGGSIDFRSGHVQPTVVLRELDAPVEVTELFSPIFNVIPYRDFDHLRTVVSGAYFADRAMGAMVYGEHNDLVEFLRRRHTVAINETLLDADNGNEPMGGRGIMANYASQGKRRVAEPILISKAVADHLRRPA